MPRKLERVSAVEAARLIGLSEKSIRRKIESGQLKAEKHGTSYAIKMSDLKKLTGQKATTPEILLQCIQHLEENQERQAEQIAELERYQHDLCGQKPPRLSGAK